MSQTAAATENYVSRSPFTRKFSVRAVFALAVAGGVAQRRKYAARCNNVIAIP
jgi:hypothetical protein